MSFLALTGAGHSCVYVLNMLSGQGLQAPKVVPLSPGILPASCGSPTRMEHGEPSPYAQVVADFTPFLSCLSMTDHTEDTHKSCSSLSPASDHDRCM